MSSSKVFSNALLNEHSENAIVESARFPSDAVALPTQLDGQRKVTTKIKKRGYRQQSAAIVHAQADGQVQLEQKTELKTVREKEERNPDGTISREKYQEPTVKTFEQTTMNPREQQRIVYEQKQQPTGQQQIAYNQAQQNALVPVDNAVSIRQQETEKKQQKQSLVLASESQKSRKKLVSEQREVSVQIEKQILHETFRKLPPQQPSIQNGHSPIPALPPTHQSNNALVPTTNENIVTQQPRPVSATAGIVERKQGMDVQTEIEIVGQGQNGEFLERNIDRHQEEEIIKEIRHVVSTPDGEYEHVQVVVERHILHEAIRELYIDAQTEDDIKDLPKDEAPTVDATSFETCMDIFCQACTCNFQNPFKRHKYQKKEEREKNIIAKQNILSHILRRGRAKGANLIKHLAFPLVGPGWRIIWVVFELLLVIVSIGFSIASYVNGSREIFNLVHLVLASISTVLALIDAYYSLPNTIKLWWKHRKSKQQEETTQQDSDKQKESEPPSEDSTCCYKCRWCGKCCCKCFEKFSDLTRTVLTELLLIPLLICDLIDFVTGLPSYSTDFESITNGILFGCGLIGILLYVYIVRIAILSGMVHYLRKARTGFVTDRQQLKDADYDLKVFNIAFGLQFVFLLHVIGQMIVQILMLLAVGHVIYVQNLHFYRYSRAKTIKVSPELWYMFVAATVLPVVGFFNFFLVNNFWVQQFPISFCLDLIKALKMPGAEELFDLKSISKDGALKVRQTIENFIQLPTLKDEYRDLQNISFSNKFAYPFKSPGMIFISTLFLTAQLGFVSCYYLSIQNSNLVATPPGFRLFWGLFYFLAPGLAFIINIHVFIIPLFWIGFITFFVLFACCTAIAKSLFEE